MWNLKYKNVENLFPVHICDTYDTSVTYTCNYQAS